MAVPALAPFVVIVIRWYFKRTEVGSVVDRLTPEIYAPTLSTRSLRLQVYESKLLLKLEPLSNDDELLIPLSIDP
jgi:hypothetical protein